MQKMYNLNRGIQLIMHSKKMIDSLLTMLETLKHTYPSIRSTVIYVLDIQMQYFFESEQI